MSTKRQPSKQRRQSQNRQQRAAVQARSEAAAASEGLVGDAGAVPTGSAQGGSALSRLTGSGASRRSSRSSRSTTTAGSPGLPPGHRAALTSVMLAAASVLFVLFAFRVPVSRATGEPITTKTDRIAEWSIASLQAAQGLDAGATTDDVRAAVTDWSPGGQESYITAFWPMSLALFLPLLGAGLGFRAVSRRGTAKLVNRAMYVTLFGALLTTQLLVFFLPAVIAMAIAAFQVRKAEVAASAAVPDGAPADVIDVDEADVDEADGDEIGDDAEDADDADDERVP